MIEALVEPLLKLLEPWTGSPTVDSAGARSVVADSDTKVDLNGAEPFLFSADSLYAWAVGDSHELNESGNPPKELERFDLTVLYVADSKDEESAQRRTRAVSDALDSRGHGYLDLIRRNRSRYEAGTPAPWQHLVGRLDHDTIRAFNVRGIALRISGYRYV